MPRLTGPTDTVRCPRCGETFGCAAKTWGCWCGELTLSAELRGELAEKYAGCLCGGCLRELATQR